MDAPERAPADFTAFVATHAARVRTACRSLSANDRLVEGVQREVFATVALRWWWLSRQPVRRRARAAAAHLDRVFRREARNYRHEDMGRGGGSDHITVGTHQPARGRHAADDLADIAWRQASRTRNRRRVFAAVAILAVGSVALLAPRRAPPPSTSEAATPLLPSSVPANVVIAPPFEQFSALPPRSTALPELINLDPGAAIPLADAPLTRAVAIAQQDLGPLIVIAEDGTTRRVDDPALAGARMHITSLSPDGMRAALTTADGLLVIDMTTGARRPISRAIIEPPAQTMVWLSSRTVVTGIEGSYEINVDTGAAFELVGVEAADVLSVQGAAAGRVSELAPVDDQRRLPGRIRIWRNVRTAPAAPTSSEPAPGDLEERPVSGPPWIGRWVGPGWSTLELLVRACTPNGLLLPPSVGVARDAIAAVARDGGSIATLAVVEAISLIPLGFLDADTVLVNTGVEEGRLLAWNVREGSLQLISSMTSYARLSVRDLLGHP